MKVYESIKYLRNFELYFPIALLLWNSNHLKSCSLFPNQTLRFVTGCCILPLVSAWFRGQPTDGTFRKLFRTQKSWLRERKRWKEVLQTVSGFTVTLFWFSIFIEGENKFPQLQEEITHHSKMQVHCAVSFEPASICSLMTMNSEAIYSWIIN